MRTVTSSLSTSLDGYVCGPDRDFGWAEPDAELFAAVTEQQRGVGVHLLGRRLYETMLFWEDPEEAALDDAERTWAQLWRACPKVVFSRTLSEVRGSGTRLAEGTVAEEIARWQAEPGDGDIAVGGPTLAAQAAAAGLVDEYVVRVCPVLVGGGTPLFPHDGQRRDLELVEQRTFAGGVLSLRYRVVR